MLFAKENRPHTLNGVLFVALFALSSLYLAEMTWAIRFGISPLIIAIVVGIFYSNTLRYHLPKEWAPGIEFAAKKILRLAIVLYGFRVTFQQIALVGMQGLLVDAFIVVSTLLLGTYLGMRLFKIDRHLSLLIAAGSAICGAAAVLAVESVIKSEPFKATVAVATVVIFGTLSMFLFPLLQQADLFGFTESQFGVFAGASVHEVAQALVAGTNVGVDAGNTAIIVKMTRVLMLVPVLLVMPIYEKFYAKNHAGQRHSVSIPWFAIGFAAVIGINSLQWISPAIVSAINSFDAFLLTMAMAAIGMETNLSKIKHVGMRPIYLALGLFVWLFLAAYCLVKFF